MGEKVYFVVAFWLEYDKIVMSKLGSDMQSYPE